MVREAGKRALQMRHFDVQLIGGMALHNGKIAEMRTGEGKTLVATLPVYLNALAGKGVHVVTVNDYLAQRDADWMGRIYRFLGLTVGVNLSQMDHAAKQAAYAADITYGTNNEFGFDYLRDNMVFEASRARAARPPLRDRRRGRLDPDRRGAHAAHHLRPGRRQHRALLPPERARAASSSRQAGREGRRATTGSTRRRTRCCCPRQGHEHAEQICSRARACSPPGSSLYDAHNIALMHHLYAALRAHALFHRDQHYVVQNGEVVIVDEFTGRLMSGPALVRRPAPGGRGEGRRADPAREPDARVDHVPELLPHVRQARRHDRHRRHRGVRVPADLPPRDGGDPDAHADGAQGRERPGVPHARRRRSTRSSPTSRIATRAASRCSSARRRSRTPSCCPGYLREGEAAARGAEREAARARGRDRRAGGPARRDHDRDQHGRPRHRHRAGRQRSSRRSSRCATTSRCRRRRRNAQIEQAARRVAGAARRGDRGRRPAHRRHRAPRVAAHRQPAARPRRPPGRPGHRRASTCRSRIRCCASSAASASASIMQRLKMPEGEPIEHPIVNRSIAKAQNRVESRNFDIRKQLLEYDDVANDQRRVIYQQRNELLESERHRRHDPQHDRRPDRRDGASATCRRNRSRSSGTSRASRRRSPREFQIAGAGRASG